MTPLVLDTNVIIDVLRRRHERHLLIEQFLDQGLYDIFGSDEGLSLTSGPVGIPSSGTLYVRLWSLVGFWQSIDYTYQIAGAALTNITGISPISGAVGTQVSITGTGFGSSSGTVSFNGMRATIVSWSATSILVQVPAGATTGTITVITVSNSAATSQQQFQVTPQEATQPSISAVLPPQGPVGQVVVINGSNFGNE